MPKTVKVSELQLGDIVKLFESGPYCFATVSKIRDGRVHFFRPYAHHCGFSAGDQVVMYTGIEDYSELQNSSKTVELWERVELR